MALDPRSLSLNGSLDRWSGWVHLPLVLAALVCGPVGAWGDEGAAYLVRVPVPIAGTVDTAVSRSIDRIVAKHASGQPQEQRPIIVLEFWPPEKPEDGSSSSFERSMALARYLAGPHMDAVRTVAYVPRTVWGHAVLPIIACEEIIMHPDAEIGKAGIREPSISTTLLGFYREIASRRQTIPVAVALGMLDPKLAVYKVTTDSGTRFELGQDMEAVREKEQVQKIDLLIPPGDAGHFTGRQMRLDLGFVSHLASDRRELAAALDVRASLLEPDPSLGGEWRPMRVDLDGIVTDKKVDRIVRTVDERLRLGATNFVCLTVNSTGGSAEASLRLAGYLADLDSLVVRTVAYVPREAVGDAALVVAACDQLVLNRGAVLGGPGELNFPPDQLVEIGESVKHVARKKGKHWSVPLAMIDPDIELRRYLLEGTTVSECWTEAEWQEQGDPSRWNPGEVISARGEILQIRGARAEELGIANFVVDSFEDFRLAYQIEDDIVLVQPGWADEFIEFLASPHIAVTLLFFAGFALMAELSTPGMGVGGFVAAVCFVLFFWSQFLHGTATWLEVLLFLTGVVFIAMEVFVLPGFGVFGFGGGALILAALVLASQTFIIPRNDYQMQQLPRSLMTVLAAGAGVTVGVVLLRRFLEKAPFLRHVMLAPPQGEQLARIQTQETIADLSGLLHLRGVAATPLMPSGKARIDGRLVDVVSDSEPIDRGTAVEVVDVQAHRVLVRRAGDTEGTHPRQTW